MALEVGQTGAAIAGESAGEAVELQKLVLCFFSFFRSTYRALGNVFELGAGEAGGNEGDEGVGELHLDDCCVVGGD